MKYTDFCTIKRIIAEYPIKDQMIKEAEMGIDSGAFSGCLRAPKGLEIAKERRAARMRLEQAAVKWALDYIQTHKHRDSIMKAVELHIWKGYNIIATARKMAYSDSTIKRRLSVIYQAVGAYLGLIEF